MSLSPQLPPRRAFAAVVALLLAGATPAAAQTPPAAGQTPPSVAPPAAAAPAAPSSAPAPPVASTAAPAPSAAPAAAPAPSAAPAAAPAARSDAQVDAVRARMEKGQALFLDKKYLEALAEFESGYAEFKFSAFLYNAAVAADKARDRQRAIARYNEFLAAVPDAPDAAEIRQKIAELERELSAPPPAEAAPVEAEREEMRSLVLIESAPSGAPVSIYERIVATAAPFDATRETNPGWRRVATGLRTPADVSLKVGTYQVVVEAFADYNLSDSRINLEPGTLFKFRANLSQGEFLGSLEVKSPASGAKVWVDDPPPHQNAPWGETPTTKTVTPGERQVWVEAPGYELFTDKVRVLQGKTTTLEARLVRVPYGYLVVDGDAYEVTVEIDGELRGVYRQGKDPIKIRLPAGRHFVEIDADGKNSWEGELVVPGGQELPVHAKLEETSGKGLALVTSLLGLGTIGGGIGLLAYADSQEAKGDRDSVDQANALRPVGVGVVVGGGVITGLSIFLWAYDPSDDSTLKAERARELTGREAVVPSQMGATAPAEDRTSRAAGARPGRSARRGSLELVPSLSPELGGAFLRGTF
jgi:hypothetical protein